MLRRSLRRFVVSGERNFMPGESPIESTGGLPFYGNIFQGRVDQQNYTPPPRRGSGLLTNKPSIWEDAQVRQQVSQCPYFALCDQVLWHGMDPVYLDPGLLSVEEHQLLLLFSRAYFEKWRMIHRRPPSIGSRIRIKYGGSALLDQILNLLDVPDETQNCLRREYMIDDACLVGMNPACWSTAYLDPANRDHLSGRVLSFADVDEEVQAKMFLLLHQMRRMVVVRNDKLVHGEPERLVIPYHCGATLHDLHRHLGLEPYSGQLKVYDYVDLSGTTQTITLKSEDAYFDYLLALFFRADVRKATLSDLADEHDNTCRYTITVEPFTSDERRTGRWF